MLRFGVSRSRRALAASVFSASAFVTSALAAAPAVTGPASATAQPSVEELQRQIQQLEQRLSQIDAKQQAADNAIDPKLVDATVDGVLRDAQRRSEFLAEGGSVTAGYDKGFFIKSEDGNFLLKPSAVFQFRGIVSNADNGDDDTDSGFELRRAQLRFDGNVISPDLTYSFVWDTNRQGGGVTLLDAWAQYKFAKEWAVKGGQFKESWTHEKDISFTGQLAVERSLVDTLLGGNLTDRVQGVSVIYGGTKDNPIRAEAAFHDGANSKNTDFRDEIPGGTPGTTVLNPAHWGVGGRFEYKVFGDWAAYRDFTAKGNKDSLLVIGAGADVTQRGDSDTYLTTLDAQWEGNGGLGAYAAVVADFTANSAGADRTDWGFVLQGSYLFNPKWEAFARYDVVLLDEDFVAGEDVFNEFTVGVNYYLGKDGSALHRAKFTADVVYLPDGSPSAQTGLGILASEDDAFVFRAQFQFQL